MTKKQFLTYAAITAASITALGAATVISVSAAEATSTTNGDTTFVQKLAEKLGVDQSKVASAVTATRNEMQATRLSEEKTNITAAVTAGKLTQRQADILTALLEIKPTKPADSTTKPEDLSSLTEAERQTKFADMKAQMQSQIIAALKDKGLTVTADELTATQTAAQTAGIRGRFGMGGHRGGMGMHDDVEAPAASN